MKNLISLIQIFKIQVRGSVCNPRHIRRVNMNKVIITVLSFIMILFLPLSAVIIKGDDLSAYLSFPPVAGYVEHNPFSWIAFAIITCFIMITVLPPVIHIVRSGIPEKKIMDKANLPWWGYAGICAGIISWIIAWTRLPLFHDLQRWTFLPLWISYITVINALCCRRSGSSLLTHRTAYMLLLFPASAAFWWIFEYLNRFTANWYYAGIGNLSPSGYFLEATLAFSTVLPAVMSTGELLKTYPRIYSGMESYYKMQIKFPRAAAFIILIASGVCLLLIPVYPELLFPFLWISPAIIILSMQSLAGEESFISSLASGDWRGVAVYAFAALICGFFWEMWNYYSEARWIYSIPYVHRFKIFEMPLLGYAGYLPFGIECAVAAGLFSKKGDEPWRLR